MISFLRNEFEVEVSPSTITRLLKAVDQSRKAIGRVAEQQDPNLRDLYLYKLSDCRSYQMIFIDESGCDKRTGHRRYGWAKRGVRPRRRARYNREQRFQVLAAYTQEGIELSRVFPGSTTTAVFEDFIDQLLHHCGRWPEPKSVLVMDNASFHLSDMIEQMCAEAGVRLTFLAPYFRPEPDRRVLCRAEDVHAKGTTYHVELYENDFGAFVRHAVDIVGARQASAEGHFRHSRIYVKQSPETP
jgi:hypothetical protein